MNEIVDVEFQGDTLWRVDDLLLLFGMGLNWFKSLVCSGFVTEFLIVNFAFGFKTLDDVLCEGDLTLVIFFSQRSVLAVDFPFIFFKPGS